MYWAQASLRDGWQEFKPLIAERKWSALLGLESGKPNDDWLQLKLLKCSNGVLVFLVVFSPFELFMPDRLEQIIFLEENEQAELQVLASLRLWYKLE